VPGSIDVPLQLGRRTITGGSRPYIIAEIGVNHGGSLELAKQLIDLAKAGGADAAKFQTYKAGSLASAYSPAYWDTTKEPTRSQRELFAKYDAFGPDEYRALAEYCSTVDIDFASTPFDAAAVTVLEPLMPFFKVASADLTNVPLLRQVARTGKPVLLSTGASTLDEIRAAIDVIKKAGCTDLVLLHCVLNYPTPNGQAHLRMIEGLREQFPGVPIGYSDHTVPDESMTPLVVAAALGAVVLEKHFTHDKSLPGNDHYHAMDVDDLRRLNVMLDRTHELLGADSQKRPVDTEGPAREHARRSIVLATDLPAGATLTEANLTTKRPAHGIAAERWDDIIGRRLRRALPDDHVLQWADLEPADQSR
jgi:sialic acid synthase SpsE